MKRQPQTTAPPTDAVDAVIARYGAASGDAGAFAAALGEPLPVCIWSNPLRIASGRLSDWLTDEGVSIEAVGWYPGAFRLPPDARPGLLWHYRAGLAQTQEEAALLSVRLLDPKPGERVLDLCAAPGNKTAQIAVALGNRGTVIANDLNEGRLAGLHATISRLGLVNVTTTTEDGRNYPLETGPFDKVLVDVPCSGEGTIRKGPGKHRPVPDDFRVWLTGVQKALLRRAIDLCRPGGRIVYSTCTFAPEENEAIIDRLLRENPGKFRLLPAAVDGLAASPGLTEWQGNKFDPSLTQALRLWPHRTDTGGFFAALLERTGSPGDAASPNDEPTACTDDAAPLLRRFIDRYGLADDIFANLRVLRSGKRLRLIADDHCPPVGVKIAASGLPLTHDRGIHPKLSTQAAMAFGDGATRNVVELSRDEIDAYFDRGDLVLGAGSSAACEGTGPVLVRHRDQGLGIGVLHRADDTTRLESLYPKNRG